jgi:TonB-linked SusC/RagA family outer membrane protein
MKRKRPASFLLIPVFFVSCLFGEPNVSFGRDLNGQRMDSTQITLELKGENLVTALKKIEKQTPFRFVYRQKEVRDITNLNLPEGVRTVSATLSLLLTNTTLTFKELNNNILIVKSEDREAMLNEPIVPVAMESQQASISGTITSSDDKTPLPGVSVVLKGTQVGTVSDGNGKYSLTATTDSPVLIFSFIGYKTMEIEVSGRSVIDIALEPDITELEEVVVTSFGIEQEKRSLGFSAQNVKGEDLIQMHQPNLVSAMQGQVAGVQITNSGGAPGQSSRIIVRGITSLDPSVSNQPLFVVDGIPIDNSTIEIARGAIENTPRGLSNRALDINPNDIEAVNVLKGAAATALYGVRAANGAIVITTKKGKAGKVQISASSTLGFDRINQFPSFQDKYGQGSNGLYNPDDIFPSWGAPIAVGNLIDPEYRYYDNAKNAMQTGKTYDNYLSISGGNEIATFYASLSNTKQDGVIPFSTWSRTVAKVSGTLKFSEKFSTSVSINYTNSGGNRIPHDRFMENLMYYPVTRDVRNFENEDGLQNYVGLSDNPLYSAKHWTYEDDVDRILGNIYLNYRPAPWVSLNYRLGTDFYSDFREEIAPGPRGVTDEFPIDALGYIEHTRITNRIFNSNFYAEFNKKLSDRFNATLRVGQEVFEEESNSLLNTGKEFDIPEFYQFSNTRQLSTIQNLRERRLIGVYGDLLLSYGDFIYLNVTGRNDWTSTLPKGNNSFFYPSYNLSFVFNEVLDLPNAITFGKLRASYGEVGKDTEPYLTSTVYEKGLGFPIDGILAYSRSNIRGNTGLKPERTTTIDVGTELKFLENRIGLEFTWYKSNSKDQIFQVPISETTGYGLFVANVGEIENRGVELIVSAEPIRSTNFQWNMTVNFSRNRNRAVKIAEGLDEFPIGEQFGYSGSTVTMKLKEGDAYGNLYGTSYQRYYPAGETPTNVRYVDRDRPLLIGANGFPVRNTNQLVLGNAQPSWIGGIRNTFSYKGISVSFLVDARWGLDQYDQFHNYLSAFGKVDYTENRNDVVVFDGLLADGTPNAKEVFLGQALGPDGVDYGQGFYRVYHRTTSENFVKDASFVKLRNVSLSYALPKTWLQKTPFQSVNVSATVNNIILWTPWITFDPESFSSGAGGNATGFSGLTYPSTMSTLFSLQLTL